MSRAQGWAVVQREADNLGYWFVHCHIEWRLATGMALLVMEGDPPAAMEARPEQ